jgi:predicted nucleotidyltransferase
MGAVNPSELESALMQILRAEGSWPLVQVAFLHGSWATGRARKDSDVDLAVVGTAVFSVDQLHALAENIERALGRRVDLADLRRAGDVLLDQVFRYGRLLFQKDEEMYLAMLKRAIYARADFLPFLNSVVEERVRRFAHG